MAALAANRDTRSRGRKLYTLTHAPGVTIFRGALLVLDAAGRAKPGVTATGLVVAGRAETGTADNPDQVQVLRGECFAFANSAAGDLLTNADWGATVYIVDDQTVAKTSGGGTRSAAGICRGVDAFGVWVEI